MKIAFETITWGIRIDNIDAALDTIAGYGFQGVEIAQRFDAIGVTSIEELLIKLKTRNLELLSLVGGSLEERLEFCGDKLSSLKYMYAEPWELSKLLQIETLGIAPALHPRIFTTIRQSSDIEKCLQTDPKLQLIVDTAHAYIAGDDPVALIKQFRNRLIAIHLKNWTPEYGRSSYRYARGFTGPDTGDIDLASVVDEIKRMAFEGWVIAELDSLYVSPNDALKIWAGWLAEKELLPKSGKSELDLGSTYISRVDRSDTNEVIRGEAQFRETMLIAAMQSPTRFYENIAKAFYELIPCHLVHVWAYSPIQEHMAFQACYPANAIFSHDEYQLSPEGTLTGIALSRHAPVTHFDLLKPNPGAKYGFPDRQFRYKSMIEKYNLRRIITLPVYNSGNQNYVRLLINLYLREPSVIPDDMLLHLLGRVVTLKADSMLDGLCISASGKVIGLVEKGLQKKEFLESLLPIIQGAIDCEGLTIFLVNETNDKLEVIATTGINWLSSADRPFYRLNEGSTGRVWARNEPFQTVNALREKFNHARSTERVQTSNIHSLIWVPLINSKGRTIGVIRCRNKRHGETSNPSCMFSEDDAAILDAIAVAASPHLQYLLAEEYRNNALLRLAHELRVPLVAMRGMVEKLGKMGVTSEAASHIRRIQAKCRIMGHLVTEAELAFVSKNDLKLRLSKTFFLGDVILPAIKEFELVIQNQSLGKEAIDIEGFEQIPKLNIDKNKFRQVFINLISNAYKYSFQDRSAFQVQIIGRDTESRYLIIFRDWGTGIESGYEYLIFEAGFRSPEAVKRTVSGRGLGLHIVKRIVEAHGGSISLTSHRLPTEFTISLPKTLTSTAR